MSDQWYVVDRYGHRVAGPYKSQERAAVTRLHLEQAERQALGLERASD